MPPIVGLPAAMQRVKSSRDYSAHAEHKANDETGPLVGTFNAMISEIRFRDASLE